MEQAPVSVQAVDMGIKRIPSFSEIWKEAWNQFKSKCWLYFGIGLIPVVMLALLGVAGAIFDTTYNSANPGWMDSLSTSFWIGAGLIGFIALVAIIIAYLLSLGGATYLSLRPDQNLTFKEVLTNTWQRMGAFVLILIFTAILSFLGSFLFLVPGIVLSIWFSFSSYIVMDDSGKGKTAIKKSISYIRGNSGKILLYTIALGILVELPLGLISFGAALLNESLGGIVDVLTTAIGTPFIIVFMSVLYRHFKLVKGEASPEVLEKNWTTAKNFAMGGLLVLIILAAVLVWFGISS